MEVFEEGDLLSYTGYSPKLADAIQLAGERVNLNIAMKTVMTLIRPLYGLEHH